MAKWLKHSTASCWFESYHARGGARGASAPPLFPLGGEKLSIYRNLVIMINCTSA